MGCQKKICTKKKKKESVSRGGKNPLSGKKNPAKGTGFRI